MSLLQCSRNSQSDYISQRCAFYLSSISFVVLVVCLCTYWSSRSKLWIMIALIGLARMDKQRMAAQSLSVHSESQQEEMNHDFSSPTSVTTVMATTSTRQTARPPRPSKKSKSPISTTTQRIDEANYTTEEVNKRTVGPLLQQHRRKETNSGVPTSFTSKASTPTTTISLYLLLFIRFLIDNHPPAWWAAGFIKDTSLFFPPLFFHPLFLCQL